MSTKSSTALSPAIDDAMVVEYLKLHPEFFVNRDKLVLDMIIPHQSSGAISLVERQVSLLRDRQLETKKRLEDYLLTARQNDAIFKKTQKLILSLVAAEHSEGFFNNLEASFRRDFKSSAYSLLTFDNSFNNSFDDGIKTQNSLTRTVALTTAIEQIGSIMKRKKPTLGVLRAEERDFLFGDQSNRVESAAIMPISHDKNIIALLAIGSDDSHYFNEAMGTLFIGFIAETLSLLLPNHLPR